MKLKFNKKFIFITLVLVVIIITIVDLSLAKFGISNYAQEVLLTAVITIIIMVLAKILHITDFLINYHILDKK